MIQTAEEDFIFQKSGVPLHWPEAVCISKDFFCGGGGGGEFFFFFFFFFDRIPVSMFLVSLLLLFVVQNKASSAAQKEITSQTDWYLVILSSKTCV